jgi:hypothetical protein
MTKLSGFLFISLCMALAGPIQASAEPVKVAEEENAPQLPEWQVLEFEEKAFWATAKSRLEVLPDLDDESLWELNALSSVVNNSEQIVVTFDPANGQMVTRSRLSRGKGQRMKSYEYEDSFVLRERRNPNADSGAPPQEWPVTSQSKVTLPNSAADTVLTSRHLLIFLAQRLQAQGPNNSLSVLVHTDLNFYRVRLTSDNGIPIEVDYQVAGEGSTSGTRETYGVAVQIQPEGTLEEDNDFDLLGLEDDIILFFDRKSGLPLQIRGVAPRIGSTKINLRSVTMRESKQ